MAEAERGIAYYLQILLRNWWFVLGAPLIAAVLVMWLTPSSQPATVYRTESRILVQSSQSSADDVYGSMQLASLYKDLIMEPSVLSEVAQAVQVPDPPAALEGRIGIKLNEKTPIMSVVVIYPEPDKAVLIANALPEVFIRQTQDRNLTRAAQLLTGASELGIVDQGQILAQQLATLGSITVIRRAQIALPEQVAPPASHPYWLVVLAAMGAVLLVIAREFLKDKVYSPENLTARLGIESLGVVPTWHSGREGSRKPIVLRHPDGVHAEAYQHVMAGLLSTGPSGTYRSRVIVVTSPGPGDGKTSAVANLAIAAAQAGKKVLVVDADLWRPDVHKWFSLPNTVGLTNLLVKPKLPMESVIRPSQLPNLKIVTAGPHAGNGFRNLGDEPLESMLASFRDQAELIIVDTPPLLARSDTVWITAQADDALIIADSERTSIRDLKAVVRSIARLQGQAPGLRINTVVNRFQPPKVVYYSYYRYVGAYSSYYGRGRDYHGGHRAGPNKTRAPSFRIGRRRDGRSQGDK